MISDGEAKTAAKRKGRGVRREVACSFESQVLPDAGGAAVSRKPQPTYIRSTTFSQLSDTTSHAGERLLVQQLHMPHNLGEQTLPGRHTTAEGDGADSMTDAKPLGRLYLRDEVQVLLPGVSPRVDAVPRRHGVQAHVARELHCRLDKLVDHLGRHHLSCAKCRDRLSKRRQLQS